MRHYVFAAEGFLQLLEKEESDLIAEDKDYLISEGGRVGLIIIDCAQNGRKWDSLSDEEQNLIIAFSNIFEENSRERANLVKVEAL